MRGRFLLACLVLAGGLAGGRAEAQPRRGPGPGPGPGAGPAALAAERREAIKKRIRALRAAELTDELKLDDKALGKLLPVLSKWDDVTEDLLKKRVDIQRRLATGGLDPKATDRLIDEAVVNQKAFWDLEDKRLAELRKILTPGQTARLLVVLPRFERRIQNQLRKAIVNRGGGGGGADFDDDVEPDERPSPRR